MKLTNPFISTLACAFAVIGLALFSVSCDKGDDAAPDPEATPAEEAPAAADAAGEAAKPE